MNTIDQAVKLAMDQFREEYGQEAQLEEGDNIATVFNDAVLIMGFEEKTLKLQVICGKPYIIDFDLNLTV